MSNNNCLHGPAFSLIGSPYFSNTHVDFQVTFDSEADRASVLAYEWYLDNTVWIGLNDRQFLAEVNCGTHTIGVKILTFKAI